MFHLLSTTSSPVSGAKRCFTMAHFVSSFASSVNSVAARTFASVCTVMATLTEASRLQVAA